MDRLPGAAFRYRNPLFLENSRRDKRRYRVPGHRSYLLDWCCAVDYGRQQYGRTLAAVTRRILSRRRRGLATRHARRSAGVLKKHRPLVAAHDSISRHIFDHTPAGSMEEAIVGSDDLVASASHLL